ncbi:hypothetical protein H5410_047265 [Solanum commersonii]|uniref:DNA/RNA-binding protein Alba-like domain-containing protein n=1 Tax=Solanum commersonii TaxID=4109 RepID=A0A9J5XGR5_SOLCO|nr:hypothetical protein H5410_047265 [Solanum commersonii]
MDRYQKVEKPKPESPINEYEIRITSQGLVRNYINYANTLLQERHGKEIVLKAMGQAISKAVAIAEIIKVAFSGLDDFLPLLLLFFLLLNDLNLSQRRMPILHQDTAISSVSITDVWEPIEEGLLPVEQTRHVSVISITLSTQELNKNSAGYQAPSEVEQMKPRYNNYQPQLQQQSPRQTRAVYYAGNEDSYGRGRGRGIGRGRGWSRGGYGNYQENGGYSNWGRENGGYSNRGRENGGYSNWGRGNGGYSNRGRGNGGYSNWGEENGGYSNRGGENGGYSNRGRGNGGYSKWGGENGGYSNRGRGNGGYSNWGRGGVRSGWEYRDINTGSGYGGGRGYGRGRGRMDLRPRGGGNQA